MKRRRVAVGKWLEDMFIRPRLGWLSLVLLIDAGMAGCSPLPPVQAPDLLKATPHTGGSVLAFDPTSQVLASGGWEGKVWIWRISDGERSHGWKAHDGSINGIGFRAGDTHVITAGFDGVLAEWDFAGRPLRRVSTGNPITHMVLDESNSRVITGHLDGRVQIWGLEDFRLIAARALHRRAVKAVAVQTGTDLVASSGADGHVLVWRPDSEPREMSGSHTDAWTLDFSPDGQWLMGGGWFRLFRWRVADGAFTSIPTRHHGIIKSIQFSPDGSYLASISRQTDSSVYFLDPRNGTVLRRFGRHELCGGYVALSPNGRYLASTADDATLRIWDLENRKQSSDVRYQTSGKSD